MNPETPQIADLQDALVRQIAVLTTMLRKREEQVNEYAHSALRIAEANAELAAKAAAAEEQLAQARRQLSKAREDLEAARRRVTAMENSRSWRWTRAMRRGK